MKIFLDCLANVPCISVGTNAFIISDIQLLNKKYPGCEIVLFSSDPDVDKLQFGHLPYNITYVKRSNNQFLAILQMKKIVSTVDAVVSAWGDGYITVPPYKLLRKALFLKKKGVPLVLFTSSIGPFNGGFKDWLAIAGLKKFDAVTVRDQVTYDYLKPHGLKKLRLVHDTAFVLEPSEDSCIENLLKRSGLGNRPFVGINTSVLLYNLYKNKNKNYINLMAEYVRWVREYTGYPVLLIPHQIYPDGVSYSSEEYKSRDGDDRYPIEEIMKLLKDNDDVFGLADDMTPQELKGVISKSEIFVGGRMHSVIAAVSLCVPSLIMKYSHKSVGMMTLLGMDKYVWDIDDDLKHLMKKTEVLWQNRKSLRDELSNMMPSIYNDIYQLTDEIDQILGSSIK